MALQRRDLALLLRHSAPKLGVLLKDFLCTRHVRKQLEHAGKGESSPADMPRAALPGGEREEGGGQTAAAARLTKVTAGTAPAKRQRRERRPPPGEGGGDGG